MHDCGTYCQLVLGYVYVVGTNPTYRITMVG